MTDTERDVSPESASRRATRLRAVLRRYFSLREGQAEPAVIDEDLRGGIGLRGTNLWILMAAIFIASIGLDVNSTAVIIGAMLVSPLMGPIMGIGYGIGIYDFVLIRRSLKSLGIATLISLATSTLYFSLSPLTGAHSELLARTSPSIWDVLIALFGGLVGMVGATRKEKTNVIPGVAIATALMPPLCTAGYGLAHGSLRYFAGAFYLFSINCVFIAFSTVLVTWAIRMRPAQQVDERMQRRVRRAVLAAVVLTAVPSVFLAYRLVADEVFTARAQTFIKDELSLPQTVVANTRILPAARSIEVTLVGRRADQQQLDRLALKLPAYGLPDSRLAVRQAGDEQIDAGRLESSLKASIVRDLVAANEATRRHLDDKDEAIVRLQGALDRDAARRAEFAQVARELHAQYPQIREVLYGDAAEWAPGAMVVSAPGVNAPGAEPVPVFSIATARPLPRADRQRLERWLRVRLASAQARLVATTG
ncbi:DUF389 domain-containing protein [Burkholderia sp. FERM BP-3421]|uniref:DUF389 domain-containing protein n=1 Tax=Burkholderia sp. FERM BP-3421 TaxID=1494466 RepID=UPI00235EC707|nr:DUF389 domain-containing protein [Burkholderia sp. FERM BP-3421]WDD94239.1 DUF389 domain-containing protein [Burkholderia sp. FERM BP-3421]